MAHRFRQRVDAPVADVDRREIAVPFRQRLLAEFGGELAHYYRFGEIYEGRRLIQVDGQWKYAGDPVHFPECYPVAQVPLGGYPDMALVQEFDTQFNALVADLEQAWAGTGSSTKLNSAIGVMFGLSGLAEPIVQTPLPSGGGTYGPDFRLVSRPEA